MKPKRLERICAPPMLENPQLLVPIRVGHAEQSPRPVSELDAIYVPFKRRTNYVKALLRQLTSFAGIVYLMPTDGHDSRLLINLARGKIQTLDAKDASFFKFYARLRTSNHKYTINCVSQWDLPMKRNFAMKHALLMGYKKILLVDDDIRSIKKQHLVGGAKCLDRYTLAGRFVEDFIDTSILGHLERAAGDRVYPFLSGSFLFVRPQDAKGFFPCLYNEDWLFMLPHVRERSICSFGSIGQVKFDPFHDEARSVFQEFGDLLVDGLYSLLANNQYSDRYESGIWSSIISQRQEFLRSLGRRINDARITRIVKKMLQFNDDITAEDCCKFIHNWEADLKSWKSYIGAFK
jgi:hypothetical protein